MTELEYIKKLEGSTQMSAPHEIFVVGKESHLRILDLSQIPGADRKYFDKSGLWIGSDEPDTVNLRSDEPTLADKAVLPKPAPPNTGSETELRDREEISRFSTPAPEFVTEPEVKK